MWVYIWVRMVLRCGGRPAPMGGCAPGRLGAPRRGWVPAGCWVVLGRERRWVFAAGPRLGGRHPGGGSGSSGSPGPALRGWGRCCSGSPSPYRWGGHAGITGKGGPGSPLLLGWSPWAGVPGLSLPSSGLWGDVVAAFCPRYQVHLVTDLYCAALTNTYITVINVVFPSAVCLKYTFFSSFLFFQE